MESINKLWSVTHIPGESELKQATVEVYAAKIEPKFASTLIRKLNSCAPLPNLGHVKRVRKKNHEAELFIILCLAPHDDDFCSSRTMPVEVLELVEEYTMQPFIATVSQHAACSREEWLKQCELWPTSYHPNAVLNTVADFQVEHLKTICEFMTAAVKQSQLAARNTQPTNGAVIVDPTVGCIVSAGHDETGGWMPATCGCFNDVEERKVQHGAQGTHGDSSHLSNHVGAHPWHPLRHAVMVAIEKAAERDALQEQAEMSQMDCNRENTKRLRTASNANNKGEKSCLTSRQYLCTGFDVYVTREPCSMCAMALLHQRVHRVFYGISNPTAGALGGLHKLHGKQGLNHHYLVFKVSLSEEDLL